MSFIIFENLLTNHSQTMPLGHCPIIRFLDTSMDKILDYESKTLYRKIIRHPTYFF